MQTVEPDVAAALKQSHQVVFRAEILDDGRPILNLAVQGGEVQVDGANAIRRKCTVTLVGDLLVPGETRTGNVALGRIVTAAGAPNPTYADPKVIVDGITGTNGTWYEGSGGADSWVQIDLGEIQRVGSVRVWHYWEDGRTYYAPRTEVSTDGVNWRLVAQPEQYAETEQGHWRRFPPVQARYVRDYISGNTVNAGNHWREIQVFTALDALMPYGNEIRLLRGVVVNGKHTYWPIGIFGITRPSVSDTGDNLLVTVTGEDRARLVQRARLPRPYTVAAGTNYPQAIRDLIKAGVPILTDASFAFMTSTRTTPELIFDEGDDRWQRAQQMAASLGAELFFDPNGVCTLQPIQASATQPAVWEIVEGTNLTGILKEYTSDATYNHVVATGEPQDAPGGEKIPPVRGEARDENPDSPTYYLGDFGDVPRFFSSPFITTAAQARDVAAALLERSLTLTERVVLDALVNPALEAYDVVQVKATRARVDGRYVLEAFSIPLDVEGAMTAALLKRRTK